MKLRKPCVRSMHQGSGCRKVFEPAPSPAPIGALAQFTLVYRRVPRGQRRKRSVLDGPVESLHRGGQQAPAHLQTACDAPSDMKVTRHSKAGTATGLRSYNT